MNEPSTSLNMKKCRTQRKRHAQTVNHSIRQILDNMTTTSEYDQLKQEAQLSLA